MTATSTSPGPGAAATGCFCCGAPQPEDRLVRLHCHDEVAICFSCLDWLRSQRAAKRRRGWLSRLPRPFSGR